MTESFLETMNYRLEPISENKTTKEYWLIIERDRAEDRIRIRTKLPYGFEHYIEDGKIVAVIDNRVFGGIEEWIEDLKDEDIKIDILTQGFEYIAYDLKKLIKEKYNPNYPFEY